MIVCPDPRHFDSSSVALALLDTSITQELSLLVKRSKDG